MTYSTAKKLLSVDIYGYSQAYKNGFFIPIASESASGYTPKDKFLSENLNQIYQKVYTLEQTFYT